MTIPFVERQWYVLSTTPYQKRWYNFYTSSKNDKEINVLAIMETRNSNIYQILLSNFNTDTFMTLDVFISRNQINDVGIIGLFINNVSRNTIQNIWETVIPK